MVNAYYNAGCVSVPYEITLLSNMSNSAWDKLWVSVPYEITLLSNWILTEQRFLPVSVPYEITLLSNAVSPIHDRDVFQYLMKLHYSQTPAMSVSGSL